MRGWSEEMLSDEFSLIVLSWNYFLARVEKKRGREREREVV